MLTSNKKKFSVFTWLNLALLWLWTRITGISIMSLKISTLIVKKCFLFDAQKGLRIGLQDLFISLLEYLMQTSKLKIYIADDVICFNPDITKLIQQVLSKINSSSIGQDVLYAKKLLEENTILLKTKQKGRWHLAIATVIGYNDDGSPSIIWSNATSKDYVKLKGGYILELKMRVLGEPKDSFLIPPYENLDINLQKESLDITQIELSSQDSRSFLKLGNYKSIHSANILVD